MNTETFRLVGDQAGLKGAQGALARAFSSGATVIRRNVNFPGPSSGYPEATLYWHPALSVWGFFPEEPRRGEHGTHERFCSFFGTRTDEATVAPTIEINLGTHRHPAGRAFFDSSGTLCIGHKGGLGGGRTSMAREPFRLAAQEQGFRLAEVTRPDGGREPVILIARIDTPRLTEDVARFVHLCDSLRKKPIHYPPMFPTGALNDTFL
jgi:hypothetical protein